MDGYEPTDYGNSLRFAKEYGSGIKYCDQFGYWYVWDGCRWDKDILGKVVELAKDGVHKLYLNSVNIADEDKRKKWVRFSLQSQSLRGIRAMIELAKSNPYVACKAEDFDKDKEFINCENCTVNIITGVTHPHCRDDVITKLVNIRYDPEAVCPKWSKYVLDIMCGNEQLAEFFQTTIGYALTGYTSEDKLFILYGGGANGKSTLFNTLKELFRPYVCVAPPGLLLSSRTERHPVELADLHGARIVITSETNRGIKFDEAKVKALTGRDWIKARYLYKDFFEFMPTHTILLSTNNRAEIDEDTEAMWRRIAEIPFKAKFPVGAPRTITDYDRVLVQEGPGILNWVIEGAMRWRAEGLRLPIQVRAAVAEYRREMNSFQRFFDECCLIGPDQSVKSSIIYERYCIWCRHNGRVPDTVTRFGSLMSEKYKKIKTMGIMVYQGIGLVTNGY